jgi:hypothetical protein
VHGVEDLRVVDTSLTSINAPTIMIAEPGPDRLY